MPQHSSTAFLCSRLAAGGLLAARPQPGDRTQLLSEKLRNECVLVVFIQQHVKVNGTCAPCGPCLASFVWVGVHVCSVNLPQMAIHGLVGRGWERLGDYSCRKTHKLPRRVGHLSPHACKTHLTAAVDLIRRRSQVHEASCAEFCTVFIFVVGLPRAALLSGCPWAMCSDMHVDAWRLCLSSGV